MSEGDEDEKSEKVQAFRIQTHLYAQHLHLPV